MVVLDATSSSDIEGAPRSPVVAASMRIGADGKGMKLGSIARGASKLGPESPDQQKASPVHKPRIAENVRQRLAAADKDGDGVLNKQEIVAVFEDLLEEEVSKRQWRRAAIVSIIAGLCLVVLLVGAVVGLTAVVIIKTKDTEVNSDTMFVAKDTKKVLGTSANSYAAFAFDAPSATIASMKQFMIAVDDHQVAIQIQGVVKRKPRFNATANHTAPASLDLITPIGTLVLEQGFETNINGLAKGLAALGIALPDVEPEVPTEADVVAGGRRRALLPCDADQQADTTLAGCYHLEHDVQQLPERLEVRRRLVAYDHMGQRRVLKNTDKVFTFSALNDNAGGNGQPFSGDDSNGDGVGGSGDDDGEKNGVTIIDVDNVASNADGGSSRPAVPKTRVVVIQSGDPAPVTTSSGQDMYSGNKFNAAHGTYRPQNQPSPDDVAAMTANNGASNTGSIAGGDTGTAVTVITLGNGGKKAAKKKAFARLARQL